MIKLFGLNIPVDDMGDIKSSQTTAGYRQQGTLTCPLYHKDVFCKPSGFFFRFSSCDR